MRRDTARHLLSAPDCTQISVCDTRKVVHVKPRFHGRMGENEAGQALHHSALTWKASADSSRMAWEVLAHSQVQQEFMRVLAQGALASAIS